MTHFTLHAPAQAPSSPCLGPVEGDLPSSLPSSFFALETKTALVVHIKLSSCSRPYQGGVPWHGGGGARWLQARVSLQSSSHSYRSFYKKRDPEFINLEVLFFAILDLHPRKVL